MAFDVRLAIFYPPQQLTALSSHELARGGLELEAPSLAANIPEADMQGVFVESKVVEGTEYRGNPWLLLGWNDLSADDYALLKHAVQDLQHPWQLSSINGKGLSETVSCGLDELSRPISVMPCFVYGGRCLNGMSDISANDIVERL